VTLVGTLLTRARWAPAGAVIATKEPIKIRPTSGRALNALKGSFNLTQASRIVTPSSSVSLEVLMHRVAKNCPQVVASYVLQANIVYSEAN
jgi:hypothetical protein